MKKDEYDVIIIGAGIGGLVCGCYLAKAGKKVLIVEKNDHVGGCCTSFERNGYKFDACVHSIGSCRKNGFVGEILRELSIEEDMKIKRYSPSDLIVAKDCEVFFGDGQYHVQKQLSKAFKCESANVGRFVDFINGLTFIDLLKKYRGLSFKIVLDEFFESERIKAILSLPILGNAGLPPSIIDASMAIILLREFIFDGGYYHAGSFQEFSNSIYKKAKEFGFKLCSRKKLKVYT